MCREHFNLNKEKHKMMINSREWADKVDPQPTRQHMSFLMQVGKDTESTSEKVCASKVYTSAEFKREKDNFQSLCKNLERAETKKWLNETLETLMKVSFEFPN